MAKSLLFLIHLKSIPTHHNISLVKQHDTFNDLRLWRMRWFFLGLVALWILVAIIGVILAFCFTGNPLCLSGFSALLPPAFLLQPIIKYLFPKDDRDYEIEKIKAHQKKSVTDDP